MASNKPLQFRDLISLRSMLEDGADVNEKYNQEPPIVYAAAEGLLGAVRLLIEFGADVNAKDKARMSGLHYASLHGYTDIVEVLIDNGANVDSTNRYGMTSLHYAAKGGCKVCASLLVKNRANINIQDVKGQTALMISCYSELSTILIHHGADLELTAFDGSTALITSIRKKNALQTVTLIRAGADTRIIEKYFKSPSMIKSAHRWIEHDAPLFFGAITGDLNSINEAIASKVSTNSKTALSTALEMASREGNAEVVEYLINHGAKIDVSTRSQGESALIRATQYGHAKIVELLVNYGENLNKTASNGMTILEIAVSLGRNEVVKKILELAEAKGVRLDYEKAYYSAVKNRNVAIQEMLRPYVLNSSRN